MKTIAYIFITLLTIVASVAEIYSASQTLKGNIHESIKWFWIGLVFGIIAVVVAYLSTKGSKEESQDQNPNKQKKQKHNQFANNEYYFRIRIKINKFKFVLTINRLL